MPQRLSTDGPGPRAPRPRGGFTLVEVVATLVILSLVGATVTSILTRQQRFYRDASETVGVRRELRGGASLLPTDLRAISTVGNDLLRAEATLFEVRAAIGSAIVCARPSALEVDLTPLGLEHHTLTSWHTTPETGDVAFVFDEGTETGAEDDEWRDRVVESLSQSTAYCPGTPFSHTAADAALPRYRLRFTADLPATVEVGAVVRLTRPARYTFYQPTGSTNWYLGYTEFRGGTWGTEQPVAGPLLATTGAGFTYHDATGAAILPTTDVLRASITRIDVQLRATGRTDALRQRGGLPFQDSLLFRVGIRNFQ